MVLYQKNASGVRSARLATLALVILLDTLLILAAALLAPDAAALDIVVASLLRAALRALNLADDSFLARTWAGDSLRPMGDFLLAIGIIIVRQLLAARAPGRRAVAPEGRWYSADFAGTPERTRDMGASCSNGGRGASTRGQAPRPTGGPLLRPPAGGRGARPQRPKAAGQCMAVLRPSSCLPAPTEAERSEHLNRRTASKRAPRISGAKAPAGGVSRPPERGAKRPRR